jgi:moderate conductance mechanosensitive channel
MSGVGRRFNSQVGVVALVLLLMNASVAGGQQLPGVLGGGAGTTGTPSGEPVDEAELRRLIETLEDPAKREELLANLRALLAAQGEQPITPEAASEDAFATVVEVISERTEVLGRVATRVVAAIERLPLFVAWLNGEWRDPYQRALWIEVGVSCLIVFGAGLLGYLAIHAVLTPSRRRLATGATRGRLARAARAPLRLLVDLVPVLAFAAAAYVALEFVHPEGIGRPVVRALIDAAIAAEAAAVLIRRVFSPDTPELRLLPISDPGARYGTRWSSRIVRTSIYGRAVLTAAGHLGLPRAIGGLLVHVLFFAVAAMAAVVIVSARRPVAVAIASLAEERRSPLLRWLPWRAIARIWHVLALAYLAFVCLVWALGIPGGFQTLIINTLATAAIAFVTALILNLMSRRAQFEPPAGEPVSADAPLIEQRLARYRSWLGTVGRGLVVLVAVLALIELWGLDVIRWLSSEAGRIVLRHLVTVTLVLIFTLVVWEAINLAIERSIAERDAEGSPRLSSRTRTLLNIIRHFVLVFLGLMALFVILAELGVNIAPLLAGAGVIGLAIGFGSQKLVQDIITGMFVLFSDTMRVGDVVEVGGRAGVVEAATLRTVVLRDYGGSVHTIPYSAIDTVTNLTKEYSFAVFDIGVGYRENVDEVMQVLHDLGAEMRQDPFYRRLILEPLEVAGVDRFADSAVVIKARFKTRPLRQWDVAREFNRRIKNRFDELGIEIPFPHQTLYFGADKQGRAPPAHVEVHFAEPAAREQAEEPKPDQAKPYLARSSGD